MRASAVICRPPDSSFPLTQRSHYSPDLTSTQRHVKASTLRVSDITKVASVLSNTALITTAGAIVKLKWRSYSRCDFVSKNCFTFLIPPLVKDCDPALIRWNQTVPTSAPLIVGVTDTSVRTPTAQLRIRLLDHLNDPLGPHNCKVPKYPNAALRLRVIAIHLAFRVVTKFNLRRDSNAFSQYVRRLLHILINAQLPRRHSTVHLRNYYGQHIASLILHPSRSSAFTQLRPMKLAKRIISRFTNQTPFTSLEASLHFVYFYSTQLAYLRSGAPRSNLVARDPDMTEMWLLRQYFLHSASYASLLPVPDLCRMGRPRPLILWCGLRIVRSQTLTFRLQTLSIMQQRLPHPSSGFVQPRRLSHALIWLILRSSPWCDPQRNPYHIYSGFFPQPNFAICMPACRGATQLNKTAVPSCVSSSIHFPVGTIPPGSSQLSASKGPHFKAAFISLIEHARWIPASCNLNQRPHILYISHLTRQAHPKVDEENNSGPKFASGDLTVRLALVMFRDM
ncbi:uncharacterized protein BDR25DRAFT_360389 [Lindgomyces ingoldianus]|uniref:Uncharacterized protein n=1 Tax=Lindgomyces ingoldianus TaxID=673940 RepID=A0ACB6QH08_9PLEO|nr:uncharacterized protein BDR25DRAFT_360389 [Lindgomyces ingoldianus]KAF2465426.1 hypothetical protein BDR25DRAFT_360389 [Lindgomyces ingoldianus]